MDIFLASLGNIILNIFSNRIDDLLKDRLSARHRFDISLVSWKRGFIRVSMAYLFRIRIDGKYLLVKGSRIRHQYQPVGGVRKFKIKAKGFLDDIGAREDNNLGNDEKNLHDLRLRIPSKNIIKFLNWYVSGKDRENDQVREFREELVHSGILDSAIFASIDSNYLYTIPTLHFSHHFQCRELLYHEVYELEPDPAQLAALRKLIDISNEEYVWVSEDLIMSLGHDKNLGCTRHQIAQHAKLLIGKELKLFN